ncbi:hypothetical protein U9M48_009180, partial [Paspalum notatum var. saurae]
TSLVKKKKKIGPHAHPLPLPLPTREACRLPPSHDRRRPASSRLPDRRRRAASSRLPRLPPRGGVLPGSRDRRRRAASSPAPTTAAAGLCRPQLPRLPPVISSLISRLPSTLPCRFRCGNGKGFGIHMSAQNRAKFRSPSFVNKAYNVPKALPTEVILGVLFTQR